MTFEKQLTVNPDVSGVSGDAVGETGANAGNGIAVDGGTRWRPIETAPQDGTRIRLGHKRDASSMKLDCIFPVRGQWDGRRWQMNSFFILPGGQHGLMSNEPTHWLPTPPEAS